MRPSTILYILKQGFANIRRNWMFSAASVLTMSACIFLFGIFFALMTNVTHIARKTEEKVPITVFFVEGITQEQIDEIEAQIRAWPEVEEVIYTSADQAWEEFSSKYFPEDSAAADSFKDDNPLENSSNLQVSMTDISVQNALVQYIQGLPNVREVKQEGEAAATLGSINNILYYTSIAIIGILFLISLFLISNTVHIGISVRKEEIGIMKYIGATDRFARAPFLLEGILLGAVGAAIPLITLYFLYNSTVQYILTRYTILSGAVEFLSAEQVYRTLGPVGGLLGIGIGFLGSFFTTRKHLRV